MKKIRTIIPLETATAIPSSDTDKDFAAKHPIDVVDPIDDNAEGNDHVFRGCTTPYDRASNRFGYDQDESEEMYEDYLLEISNRALERYVKGAMSNMGTQRYLIRAARDVYSQTDARNPDDLQVRKDVTAMHRTAARRLSNRNDGVTTAFKKAGGTARVKSTNEERIDEVSVGKLDAYGQKAASTIGSLPKEKAMKRRNMMGLASMKGNLGTGHNPSLVRSKTNPKGFVPGSVKEEQLDEISDDLKRRYAAKADNDAWGKKQEGQHLEYARGLSPEYKRLGRALRAKGMQRSHIVDKVRKDLGESVQNPKSKSRLNRIDYVLNKSIDRDVNKAMKDHKDPDDAERHADRNPSKRTTKLDNAWKSEFRSQRALHKEGRDELEEGRLRAAAKGLGRFISNLPAVPIAAVGGAVGSMPTAAITGDSKVMGAGAVLGGAAGLGYAVNQGIKGYKSHMDMERTNAKYDELKFNELKSKPQPPSVSLDDKKKKIASKAAKTLYYRQHQQNRIKKSKGK